jgi:hypothetical protein
MKSIVHHLIGKSRLLLLGGLVAVMTSLSLAPTAAEAALSVPVGGKSFNGTFTINSFASQVINGSPQLVAVGTLMGTETSKKGGTINNIVIGNIVVPVNIAGQTCPILHLELGPLNLDLLGLVVDLNQIVLDITAVPGAGNLLGNLLCAVAGLLDPGSLTQLIALLNQILDLLG